MTILKRYGGYSAAMASKVLGASCKLGAKVHAVVGTMELEEERLMSSLQAIRVNIPRGGQDKPDRLVNCIQFWHAPFWPFSDSRRDYERWELTSRIEAGLARGIPSISVVSSDEHCFRKSDRRSLMLLTVIASAKCKKRAAIATQVGMIGRGPELVSPSADARPQKTLSLHLTRNLAVYTDEEASWQCDHIAPEGFN